MRKITISTALLTVTLIPAVSQKLFSQNTPCIKPATLQFVGGSIRLNNIAKNSLELTATNIKDNPECHVVVRGYCSSSKRSTQLSWDRVNVVISYLVDKEGISADRFIFVYGGNDGDCNTVETLAAEPGEEGPSSVPPPHPNLHRNH